MPFTFVFIDLSIVVPRLKLATEQMISCPPPKTSSFTNIDDVICKYGIDYIVPKLQCKHLTALYSHVTSKRFSSCNKL